MILFLIPAKNEYTDNFIKSLKNCYKINFIAEVSKENNIINYKRLKLIEEKLKLIYILDEKFDLYNICIKSIENSLITKIEGNYLIYTDSRTKFKDIKIDNLLKSMNDGMLEIDAYPIFTLMEKKLKSNLDNYFLLYLIGII